jgi:apolipoprotein N-acyltransferase
MQTEKKLKSNRNKILFASLSALLMALIFPDFDLHFLAWIALIPLFLVIRRSTLQVAFLSSLITGFIFYCALLRWTILLNEISSVSFILGMLGNTFYFGVFGLLAYFFQKELPQWNAFTFPAVWVLLEYLRSHMSFLSFPWGILGYSQYTFLPVAEISSFTGVYGVSFIIVAVNTIFTEIIYSYFMVSQDKAMKSQNVLFRMKEKLTVSILTVTTIIVLLFIGTAITSVSYSKDPSNMKIALIQGDVYSFKTNDVTLKNAILEKYKTLSMKAANERPELIAWPSSSVPGRIPYDLSLVRWLSTIAKKSESFLLIGAAGYDKLVREKNKRRGTANSAFLFAPYGKIIGRYDKMKLLPFDEYLPLRKYVQWPSWLVSSDFIDSEVGKEMTIFDVNNRKFGVLICWENLFPDLTRQFALKGADFMVNMTNEAFTKIPSAHYQMLAMSVFRAIENNMYVLRSSTTGVSCIIDPQGRITKRVQDSQQRDVNIDGLIVGDIQVSSERTFYTKYGDWFVYALFISMLTICLLLIVVNTFRCVTKNNHEKN